MKLVSYLQSQGFSRRKITTWIRERTVFVNGFMIESFSHELQDGDEIVYGDLKEKCLFFSSHKKISHILSFFKPVGYVCSKSDPHNVTIYELLPQEFSHYYYIGRLDKESRGLVLLTDDPVLVDQYEHPRHGITKEYLVTLNKPLKEEDRQRCLSGIQNEGDLLKAVECSHLTPSLFQQYQIYFPVLPPLSCVVKIVLNEGKKRHIRRMMSGLRYHVEDLMRVREGVFVLGDLKEGQSKFVN